MGFGINRSRLLTLLSATQPLLFCGIGSLARIAFAIAHAIDFTDGLIDSVPAREPRPIAVKCAPLLLHSNRASIQLQRFTDIIKRASQLALDDEFLRDMERDMEAAGYREGRDEAEGETDCAVE
jgi:hypothetical protein